MRGLSLAWFWLDEAPLCGYYAWQMLKARLRQRGQAVAGWATGTPHGRDGFYVDFERSPRAHHALFRASTLANAANLPEDYVTDLGLSVLSVLGGCTPGRRLSHHVLSVLGVLGGCPTARPHPRAHRRHQLRLSGLGVLGGGSASCAHP